jgi:DNA-directed RNA polymerase subunit beta'
MDKVLDSYGNGNVMIKDKIILVYDEEPVTTTVGRVIFNSILPEKMRFMNSKVKNKDLKKILSRIFDEYDMPTTVHVADDIKDFGFKYSTLAGTSINILDMKVPKGKDEELRIGDIKSNEIYKYYFKGFFSDEEKHRLVVKLWTEVKKKIEESLKGIT